MNTPCRTCNGSGHIETDSAGLIPCHACQSTGEERIVTVAHKRSWVFTEWTPPQDKR